MLKSAFIKKPSVLSSAIVSALLLVSVDAMAAGGAAPVSNGVSQVNVTLTGAEGGTCIVDHSSAKAGPVTFTVVNKTATAITELELLSDNRILGEKENLAPGLPAAKFTLTLDGGKYQIYCPGAKQELINFTVTGKSAAKATGSTAELLKQGTVGYSAYVNGVVDAMVVAVDQLKADIDAGDLERQKPSMQSLSVLRTYRI